MAEEQALDVVLKTFVYGLLPKEGRWTCLERPTEIAGAPGFTFLAGGEDGCLGITPEGDVHRWAAQKAGFAIEWSLSVLKDEGGQRLQLRDVAVGCGRQRPNRIAAVALMDGGDVFTTKAWYGDGGDGREGAKPLACPNWQPVPDLQATLVVAVACGGGFAMALTAGGELLAWGDSPSGALGIEGAVSRPRPVHALAHRRVAVVACGESHTIAATFDEEQMGPVYSWGLCAADGRLGYVDDEVHPQSLPREIPWLTADFGDLLGGAKVLRDAPRSRRLPQRITQVSCGSRHSVLVCQGALVCFGDNGHGQLGETQNGRRLQLPSFAHCPVLKDQKQGAEEARRLCCGPLHTACVSSSGRVYVWGLDLRDERQVSAPPWQVPEFGPERPVVALTCGAHFIVCSAEVVLPAPQRASMPQEELLLGCCSEPSKGAATSWRPSHLPPKHEQESEHHRSLVRELERNVQKRLQQEQRKEEQRQLREERRERRLKEHTEIWLQLLPSLLPGGGFSARMQRLWRQGLPPKVREVVWPLAIGNVLRITPELFQIHQQRALDARKVQEHAASNMLITLSELSKEQSTTCIPFDLPRTFPTLAFFDEGGPLHNDCARILEAYTFFRPDVGYVQGMSFLAAMLLLYLPPYQAFVGLCNLLNTPSVLGLYRLEPQAVRCRAGVFEQLCSQQLPAVARCIEAVGLAPEMFLIDWFLTIFSKCLTVDVASVVWDLFLLDGEVVLYCTAIAIFRILEEPLLHPEGRRGAQPDLESCCRVLNEELRGRVTDSDELLWHIDQARRKAPQRICAEIRAIENTEFGTGQRHPGSFYTPSFFEAARDRISSSLNFGR